MDIIEDCRKEAAHADRIDTRPALEAAIVALTAIKDYAAVNTLIMIYEQAGTEHLEAGCPLLTDCIDTWVFG